jgi:hypothetical protein
VEGHDFEVLSGLDLKKYKPKLIIIEILDFSFKNYQSNKIVSYLEKPGYRIIGFYNINGFFIRNDLVCPAVGK